MPSKKIDGLVRHPREPINLSTSPDHNTVEPEVGRLSRRKKSGMDRSSGMLAINSLAPSGLGGEKCTRVECRSPVSLMAWI